MKNWWLGLAKREQNLVIAMGAVVVVFIFYYGLWQPLNENLVNSQKNVVNKQQLLSWVNENTAKFKGVKVKSSGNRNTGSLTSIVNTTAKRWNITVARMQPKGEAIQVWIDEVAFNDFLAWTEHLYLNQGVLVNAADIAEANDPGMVRINRLELSKG